MGLREPELLHKLLTKLADNLAEYACYQIESGAQTMQMFDSWAGNLSPTDYDTFSHPYQKRVVEKVKAKHPDVPFITYIAKSAALLERMAQNGGDIVSVDWTVHLAEARKKMGAVGVQVGPGRRVCGDAAARGAGRDARRPVCARGALTAACPLRADAGACAAQGNLDPAVLLGTPDVIVERTHDVIKQGGGKQHVVNLGHGIEPSTPEENAKLFVDTVKAYRY